MLRRIIQRARQGEVIVATSVCRLVTTEAGLNAILDGAGAKGVAVAVVSLDEETSKPMHLLQDDHATFATSREQVQAARNAALAAIADYHEPLASQHAGYTAQHLYMAEVLAGGPIPAHSLLQPVFRGSHLLFFMRVSEVSRFLVHLAQVRRACQCIVAQTCLAICATQPPLMPARPYHA